MEQFFVLTEKGKITQIKPYNPFHETLIDHLNKFDGSNPELKGTQVEIMGQVLLRDGIRIQLSIATIPGTNIPAINWDTDTVLHHLILVQ